MVVNVAERTLGGAIRDTSPKKAGTSVPMDAAEQGVRGDGDEDVGCIGQPDKQDPVHDADDGDKAEQEVGPVLGDPGDRRHGEKDADDLEWSTPAATAPRCADSSPKTSS